MAGPLEAPGVTFSGPVDDDADIYRRGRLALNFQQSTGGIKLKTLTSLAAGRTLISTVRGIEGVPITSGQHFWDMGTFLSNRLRDILADTAGLQRIAQAGRAWWRSITPGTSLRHSSAVFCRQSDLRTFPK